MNNKLIKIENLNKSFNKEQILKNINLEVNKGELISIIGSSGCGKTTLLRCLNCLEIMSSGSITIDDINLSIKPKENILDSKKSFWINRAKATKTKDEKLKKEFRIKTYALRRQVGFLFQSFNLFPHLSVLENVTIAPIKVKGENKQSAENDAKVLLKKVGLEKYIDRKPYQLSGGQAQRVAIARALAMNPKVMLYDEPTSALDPTLTEEVLQVMRKLHSEGMTQIVVTHVMDFARTASDYVIYMDEGEIIEKSSPELLFSKPNDPRTAKYLNIKN